MHRILAAITVITGIVMFSLSAVSYETLDVSAHSAPDVVLAKKKCKPGYDYDKRTKKCYPRGSH